MLLIARLQLTTLSVPLVNSALDCFSEDTLEPLARSVADLLDGGRLGDDLRGGEATRKSGIALVVYKSRLPARESAFFKACRVIGLDVCGPFGDDTSSKSMSRSNDDNKTAGTATVAGDGAGRALIFSLRLASDQQVV